MTACWQERYTGGSKCSTCDFNAASCCLLFQLRGRHKLWRSAGLDNGGAVGGLNQHLQFRHIGCARNVLQAIRPTSLKHLMRVNTLHLRDPRHTHPGLKRQLHDPALLLHRSPYPHLARIHASAFHPNQPLRQRGWLDAYGRREARGWSLGFGQLKNSVEVTGRDCVGLDVQQVLARQVAEDMTRRKLQKELTAQLLRNARGIMPPYPVSYIVG